MVWRVAITFDRLADHDLDDTEHRIGVVAISGNYANGEEHFGLHSNQNGISVSWNATTGSEPEHLTGSATVSGQL